MLANPRSKRPQVQHIERCADEEEHRVDVYQRLDDPEAHIGQAPDWKLASLPPTDKKPFGRDWKATEADEGDAHEEDSPQVEVDPGRSIIDPIVAPCTD